MVALFRPEQTYGLELRERIRSLVIESEALGPKCREISAHTVLKLETEIARACELEKVLGEPGEGEAAVRVDNFVQEVLKILLRDWLLPCGRELRPQVREALHREIASGCEGELGPVSATTFIRTHRGPQKAARALMKAAFDASGIAGGRVIKQARERRGLLDSVEANTAAAWEQVVRVGLGQLEELGRTVEARVDGQWRQVSALDVRAHDPSREPPPLAEVHNIRTLTRRESA